MKFSLVALLGLSALNGQFTANARALPNSLALSSSPLTARDAEYFAVEKLKRAGGGTPGPRPGTNPKPPTTNPRPGTNNPGNNPGKPAEGGVRPFVESPAEPANPEAGLDHVTIPPEIIDVPPLEVQGSSALEVKPATPRTDTDRPNPNTAPKQENLRDGIESDPANNDGSDDVESFKTCKLAKRGLSPAPVDVALEARSGDKGAVNWETWKRLFAEINAALQRDPRITRQLPIYVLGGTTGLSLGSRGPDGKSADADVIHDPATTPEEIAAFNDAVAGVYEANKDIINDDFINVKVSEIFTKDNIPIEDIIMNSNEAAWDEGDKLRVVNAWYGIQLANKMDRMTNMNAESRPWHMKDLQDSTAILKRMVANNNGEKITLEQFNGFSNFIKKDPEELIAAFGRKVSDTYDGFARSIMERIEFYEARLKALEGSDSDEC